MQKPMAKWARQSLGHGALCLSVVLIAIGVLGSFSSSALAADTPDWKLEAITGETVSFHDELAKGPVVLSFWATWCKPCLKEMPHLDALAEKYDGQISVLAISTDASKSVAKVAPFINSKGFKNFKVLLDSGAEVQNLLQVGSMVPFLIMFDSNGREIYRHVGYKDGDEVELEHQMQAALKAAESGLQVETNQPAWSEAVTATDRFEYSYSTEKKTEIFENWLDVSYQFGGFRTGIMLNSQAPSEEGDRSNEIKHRFFEFNNGQVSVRAGHFYGLFGRGLIFNSYEDRTVRVDTRLDGLKASYQNEKLKITAFSGTPSLRELDIRALDVEYNVVGNFNLAATGLTYRPDLFQDAEGKIHRESVSAVRARETFGFGDFYVEHGWKTGYDFNPIDDDKDPGTALYGNLNLYKGPFSASWEYSDYDKFEVVSRADGLTALNRPPALAREFTWTLLNRAPHTLNANDEKGQNLDLMFTGSNGWTVLLSGADIERHDGDTLYQLAYGSVEKERFGDFRFLGAFGYQDSEGLRQTVAGELTWFASESQSVSLQAEQQHVRVGGGVGFDLGEYDQQWYKLEYEIAPRWAFSGILEVNNKFDEQRSPTEEAGPFPAGQIAYTLASGGNLNLWFGQRQAGFLCSGGVCKFEPEFSGVEVFGVFRY
ncbi:MAG: cytochrome c biogenesis protein CcmG/thiol:disulfide interchange protein DsbE [Candidatus Krumholzibacteriia bacterium]|jgi:cytochrome c biogenesis protein CcmG/thiol:disulfide interchange protein DsbE